MAHYDYCSVEAPARRNPYIEREYRPPQGPPPPPKKVTMLDIVENHLCCGVCQYPCHEVVVITCGHKFCKVCLENSKDVMHPGQTWPRPRCPTCTMDITSTIRLYDDDRMIGSIMDNFAPDLTGLYASARRRKQNASIEAENRKYESCQVRRRRWQSFFDLLVIAFLAFLIVVVVVRSGEYERLKNPEHFNEQVAQIKTAFREAFVDAKEFIVRILLKMEKAICKHCMSALGVGAFDPPHP